MSCVAVPNKLKLKKIMYLKHVSSFGSVLAKTKTFLVPVTIAQRSLMEQMKKGTKNRQHTVQQNSCVSILHTEITVQHFPKTASLQLDCAAPKKQHCNIYEKKLFQRACTLNQNSKNN